MEQQSSGFKRFVNNVTTKCTPSTIENVENCADQYNTKIDQLTASVTQLKDTVEKLKATIVAQNSVIMEALASQKLLMQQIIGKESQEAEFEKIFPIKTVDELTEINGKIKSNNRAVYTRCLSSLLRGQLHKSLHDVFGMDLIVASNVDGIHGKLALKQYKNLFDALLDAIKSTGELNPEKALRNAFKLIKKRHFQSVCVSKKKESNLSQ